MKLVIVHYHLRPGGVRRVIELASAHLAKVLGEELESIVIATGEKPDVAWQNVLQKKLGATPVTFFVEPTFNYLAEQKLTTLQCRRRLKTALEKLCGKFERHVFGKFPPLTPLRGEGDEIVVWAHNLGIGRNLLLSDELTRFCAARKIPLLLHHHDWWFDNRWRRWPEMRRAGFATLDKVARAIFVSNLSTQHIAINEFDTAQLRRGFGKNAHWLPNLIERAAPPSVQRIRAPRDWLQEFLDEKAPVWILPCRALRRKNMAEALLLTRWLRPEAWLVTTGGASSADEQIYFERLELAAKEQGWRLRLGILRGDESKKPSVAELLAASEAVLLTSIQEGFGLPYLEAAAAGRPLFARSIPNIAPDLKQLGFRFPQYYDEILIEPGLFDWKAEQQRQFVMFNHWQKKLPRLVQGFVSAPEFVASKATLRPMPFSRLTLTAQLEVLSQPIEHSWRLCAPLNPFLKEWRKRASAKQLQITPWPRRATEQLSGKVYAERLLEIACSPAKNRPNRNIGPKVQDAFLHAKLDARFLFPLLWSTHT